MQRWTSHSLLVSQQLNGLYFASLYRNCIQFLPSEALAPQLEYRSFIKDAVQRTQKSIDEWLLHPLKETEDVRKSGQRR